MKRTSKETEVRVEPSAELRVNTGLRLFDHMLTTFCRYADLSLSIYARGDLNHHLIEDVGITLGTFLARVTPEACARYGERTVPMDDALVRAVLDLSGRPYFRGVLPSPLYQHFLYSFAHNAQITLHIDVLAGGDRHHIHEAAFKATGLALKHARAVAAETFSTKGNVKWEDLP